MKLSRPAVSSVWLCALLCICAVAEELSAGVARVEITPPVGYLMGGYAARQ